MLHVLVNHDLVCTWTVDLHLQTAFLMDYIFNYFLQRCTAAITLGANIGHLEGRLWQLRDRLLRHMLLDLLQRLLAFEPNTAIGLMESVFTGSFLLVVSWFCLQVLHLVHVLHVGDHSASIVASVTGLTFLL